MDNNTTHKFDIAKTAKDSKTPQDYIVQSSDGEVKTSPEFQQLLSAVVTKLDMLNLFLWSRAISTRKALKHRRFMHSNPQAHAYSCEGYLTQVILVGEFDRAALIYAFILLERYISSSKIRGGKLDFNKLIAVTFFIAFKLLNDNDVWHLKQFEDVSDIDQDTMRELEIAFLKVIKFRAHVSPKELDFYEMTLLDGDSSSE